MGLPFIPKLLFVVVLLFLSAIMELIGRAGIIGMDAYQLLSAKRLFGI